MQTTPPSLLQRIRNPDPACWERFVELYTPLLFSWAGRLGLQSQDASDLVQDVFVVLVQKLPQFQYQPTKSFRAWLKTVTLNLWRTRARDKVQLAVQHLGDRAEASIPDAAEAFWEEEYRRRLLRRAMDLIRTDFEPKTWEACRLCVMNGRSASEVAQALGLSVATVYTAKSRVLRHLRQELEGMLD